MRFTNLLSDEAVNEEIGRRVAAARLELQMTQADLAEAAGVSKRTVERLEDGEPPQLVNWIRCLRALGKLEGLERLLPETPVNPVDLLKARRRRRIRARPSRTDPRRSAPADTTGPPGWTWSDDT